MEVLSVTNLSKHYKRAGGAVLRAVDDISFTVKEGEILGFLGPNGAGKSTTIKMIAGQAAPTAGEVRILGHSVQKEREAAMSHVGGVIEAPDLYLDMTGFQNLKYFASLHPRASMVKEETAETLQLKKREIDLRRIADVLEMVGLTARKDDLVKRYSLGMKQRLGIAQALLSKPKLLILDEPANGLDPAGIREIRNMLRFLAAEYQMAILVSSHQLGEMQLMCDRVMIISGGKITAMRNIDELARDAGGKTLVQIKLDDAAHGAAVIREKFGYIAEPMQGGIKIRSDIDISTLTRELVLAGCRVFGVQEQPISLEDLFIEATSTGADIPTPAGMGMGSVPTAEETPLAETPEKEGEDGDRV